jgi:D-amino peptidase
MKVYISVDMEGISGVVHWNQTVHGKEDYDRFRKLMTYEANAAIEGALLAGASEVVVNDSHGSMRNIILEELRPEAKIITGSNKPMSMMEGMDGAFDAAIFIGYHSKALSTGILNHTFTGSVSDYKVNGQSMGEAGMNALIAGYYGVPVVFVSGDSELAKEAQDLLKTVNTVAVKEARSQMAALCLNPAKARQLITQGVQDALKDLSRFKPLVPPAPATVTVKFKVSIQADGAQIMPGAVRLDPVTVEFTGKDYLEAYRGFRTMLALAR